MESLIAPRHKERILMALSHVPIATTKQLAILNNSLDPIKKASLHLRELEREKIIQSQYHGREKIWSLTPRGRRLQGITATRLSNVDHMLAVGNLYFTMCPKLFLFEPKERFEHLGEELTWNPDCILVQDKKLYAVEVQLARISAKRWANKWRAYNTYFNHGYFLQAEYQKWGKKPMVPQLLVFTNQDPKNVENGFMVKNRNLIISKVAH